MTFENTEKEMKMTRKMLLQTIRKIREEHHAQIEQCENNRFLTFMKDLLFARLKVVKESNRETRDKLTGADFNRNYNHQDTFELILNLEKSESSIGEIFCILAKVRDWESKKNGCNED